MYRPTVRSVKGLLPAIVTGSNIICTELLRAFKKCIEFYLSVTQDIRIRSTSLFILIEHIIHHPLPILFAQIDKIKRDAYLSGHKFSHKTVFLPLAVTVKRGGSIMPVLHEKRKHIISLTLKQESRNT